MAENTKEMIIGVLAIVALILIMTAPLIVKCAGLEKCLAGLM